MADEVRTVEINGINVEVDMRTARKVERYRVGDQVKVLVKDYSRYKAHPGVIVAFDAFEKLPTITVAYLEIGYASAEIKFAYINAQEEDAEIAPHSGDLLVDKADVLAKIDKDIASKEREIEDLRRKRDYFERHFARYFEDMVDLAERVDG